MLSAIQQMSPEAHNPVELLRACASALSFVSEQSARDVHILSLRRAYARMGTPGELRYATRILNFVGEIQDLGFGYWFPAPTRAVHVEQFAVVLSISPTWELSRHFALTTSGIGRTARNSEVSHLAKQQLSDWLEVSDVNRTESNLSDLLLSGIAGMRPSSPDPQVEFLSSSGRRSDAVIRWSRDHARASLVDSMALCRRRVSANYARYFVGKVSARGLTGESIEIDDPDYAQYIFSIGCGSSIAIKKCVGGNETTFEFPIRPPRAERKLLLTLTHRIRSANAYVYSVQNDYAGLIERQIKRLGICVRSLQ